MSESSSNSLALSVTTVFFFVSLFVLPFDMSCNWGVKAGHDTLGKSNSGKQAFINVVVRHVGEADIPVL